MTMSIKITSAPTPISSIINGMGLGVIGFSNPFTWVLIVIIGISTYSMGKDKIQKIMASFTPP